jgi:hypothetical protein
MTIRINQLKRKAHIMKNRGRLKQFRIRASQGAKAACLSSDTLGVGPPMRQASASFPGTGRRPKLLAARRCRTGLCGS